ncbi:hypothetical protein [Mycoplasma suis]|uniref:Uncharacterized protein n=1 Tax=Mycoplasma suis (strain KI_3806) TaxID=708248 RepID=F0V1Y2_MYCS3|nr:hypothetical protein [Mycoplasma suis]CBZ40663.1 hypothetical protein MSUIS_05700 [Mycoplasma suis KI3806]
MSFLLKGILSGILLVGSGGVMAGGYIFRDNLSKIFRKSKGVQEKIDNINPENNWGL